MEFDFETIMKLKDKINLNRVFSSNIAAIGYNSDLKLLKVIFNNNTTYIYSNVEPEVWNLIANAESKGKALRENIIPFKDKYKYFKIG